MLFPGNSFFRNVGCVSASNELPVVVKEFETGREDVNIVINIHPTKQVDWEQSIVDVIMLKRLPME